MVAIYNTNGAKVAGYAYDAFGNCTATGSMAQINPIRYRGYYWDSETNWYYLNARYYSPEWRRFISPDDTAYLNPENVNGLNLYCYCNNDPVNYADPSGHNPEWYNILGLIGAGLVVAAATVLTLGAFGVVVGGAGILGAVIHGAAVGTLIGAGIGVVGGAAGGMIYDAVAGNEFGTSIWAGVQAGFGIGAIAGAVIGGAIGYSQYYVSQSLLNSYKLPEWDAYDCSEIADDLYKMAKGKGKILNIKPKNANFLNVYSMYDDFVYHTVYSRGMFILDPRYSNSPIIKSAYMQALKILNKGIQFFITRG